MNLQEFFSTYSNEQVCRDYFKQQREGKGITCKQCGHTSHLWIDKQNKWQCRKCKYRTGLKYGTVMENSNLNYRLWLWALYLMSLTKKGFSALEMQRLLGHHRYEPIWYLMQKIRMSMGNRDAGYKLTEYIEMDEGFFEGHRKKDNLQEPNAKPVKELDRQVKAIVAVSTIPVPPDKQKQHRPKTKAGYLKMSVVDSLSSNEVHYEAQKMLDTSAKVRTDRRTCYRALQHIVAEHKEIVVKNKKEVSSIFPWVHTAISNAKRKILGLHHQVKDCYMQNYLNEFCYKFNRRFFGEKLFDRLVVATISAPWHTKLSNSG